MKLLIIDPNTAILWEHTNTSPSLLKKAREEAAGPEPFERQMERERRWYKGDDLRQIRDVNDNDSWGWTGVPPIPLFEAPIDLLDLGQYVLYEGHHRREAAKRAGSLLPCELIESDEDIEMLIAARQAIGTGWGPMFKNRQTETLPPSYAAHRNFVWERARQFHSRRPEQEFNGSLKFLDEGRVNNFQEERFILNKDYYPKCYR